MERPNGFLSAAGYAWWSSAGTGVGVSACLLLLKALRREAKDAFFVNGEEPFVATEDWVECVKGALLVLRVVWIDCPESCEAMESPREWK